MPAVVAISGAAGIAAAVGLGAGVASAWSAPLLVAATVLVAAGVAKVHEPEPSRRSLAAIGVALPSGVVRSIGAAEVAVGIASVVGGGTVAALAVCVAYLGFAAVALAMSRSDGVESCGCFGASGSRPGVLHVSVNLAAVVGAIGAAAVGAGGVVAVLDDGLAHGAVTVASAVVGSVAVIAVLTVATDVLALARRPAADDRTFHLVEAS